MSPEATRHPTAAQRSGDAAAPRNSVSALERGFAVLRCFAPGVPALTHQQIARQTGLPKATVSRVAQTLVRLGYLDNAHDDGRYRMTARTLDIGQVYLANVDMRSIAQPLMRALADDTNSTVNLVARSGDHMVVVETVRSDSAVVAINSRIGFPFPILQTAIGRAYLAGLPRAEQADAILALRGSVPAHAWKALRAAATRALKDVQDKGFCALAGEWRPGVNSVATPIRGRPQGEIYVINCAGPAQHLPTETMESQVGPRLLAIARQIEDATHVHWRQP